MVSLGALDMVNFGPAETVPKKFRKRRLYCHNPDVTLMRTSPGECAKLGAIMARKLNRAKGPLTVFMPTLGTSSISKKGQVFHDAQADSALVSTLLQKLNPAISRIVSDVDINDRGFALAMAQELDIHMKKDGSR